MVVPSGKTASVPSRGTFFSIHSSASCTPAPAGLRRGSKARIRSPPCPTARFSRYTTIPNREPKPQIQSSAPARRRGETVADPHRIFFPAKPAGARTTNNGRDGRRHGQGESVVPDAGKQSKFRQQHQAQTHSTEAGSVISRSTRQVSLCNSCKAERRPPNSATAVRRRS